METSPGNRGGKSEINCLSSLSGRMEEVGCRSEIYNSWRLQKTLAARLDLQESRRNMADSEFPRQNSGEGDQVFMGWWCYFLSSIDLGQDLEEYTPWERKKGFK